MRMLVITRQQHRGPALSLGVSATFLAKYDEVFSPGAEPFIGAGTLSLPHWRGLGHADWQRGAWTAGYQLQYSQRAARTARAALAANLVRGCSTNWHSPFKVVVALGRDPYP